MSAKILRGPGTYLDYNVKGVEYVIIYPDGETESYVGNGETVAPIEPRKKLPMIIKEKKGGD